MKLRPVIGSTVICGNVYDSASGDLYEMESLSGIPHPPVAQIIDVALQRDFLTNASAVMGYMLREPFQAQYEEWWCSARSMKEAEAELAAPAKAYEQAQQYWRLGRIAQSGQNNSGLRFRLLVIFSMALLAILRFIGNDFMRDGMGLLRLVCEI